jgi:predicted dithiol-disulfide oxidoreductase (DUF899 family)
VNEIEQLRKEISQKIARLNELQKQSAPIAVPNYSFQTLDGSVTLLQLFGNKSKLFAIHNMGQGCRYCTTWADGINAFLPHLESEFAVVLLSKDPPDTQRTFANMRGWRFRMASHGGGDYIREQSVVPGESNMPGMVCYARQGDQVARLNSAVFGPGDLYCSIWHILSLGGISEEDWTPQYAYWKRPQKLDDGGLKTLD